MRVVYALTVAFCIADSTSLRGAEDEYEIAFLKQHGISNDLPGLLGYLKSRTLDDARIKRVGELIAETGHPRFAVRDRAAKELLKYGVSVLRFLEAALRDKDPEVADRAARLIEQIKNGPGSSLPTAVLRRLAKLVACEIEIDARIAFCREIGVHWIVTARLVPDRLASDVVVALFDFVPFADDTSVEDEVLLALRQIANSNQEAVKYFADPFAARRAAAGYRLGQSRIDANAQRARKLLADPDPWIRLRTAQGMVIGEHRDAVPALIGLIDAKQNDIVWRAEDLLRRIAREDSPAGPTDDKPETRKAYLAAWGDWWKRQGQNISLAGVTRERPLLNLFLCIEYNTNSVWECARDGKRLWTVTAQGPMDAQVLPGNRVLIAEQSAKRVSERDFKGNTLWEYPTTDETLNCLRLPNGNTWIGTRHSVMEVRPDKSVVYSRQLSEAYMHAVRRLPNGGAVGITAGGLIQEMNAAGKKVRGVQVPHEGTWGDVDVLPSGNYLVSNYGSGFVREVDPTGKTIREVKTPAATGVERQRGGQLLVGGGGSARLIDWSGRTLWSTKSNGSIRRIHLR